MWKTILSDTAEKTLEDYIISYREVFENLYDDSGIWSEDYIVEAHRRESLDLKNAILEHIQKRFESDFLPFQEIGEENKKSVLFVRNRMIFLEYFADEVNKMRYIRALRIIYKR